MRQPVQRQDVESTVFYHEFGEIMMRAPVIGLEFTRYLPLALVPFVLLQVRQHLRRPPSTKGQSHNMGGPFLRYQATWRSSHVLTQLCCRRTWVADRDGYMWGPGDGHRRRILLHCAL